MLLTLISSNHSGGQRREGKDHTEGWDSGERWERRRSRGWRGMQEAAGIMVLLTAQWGHDGLLPVTSTMDAYIHNSILMCLISVLFALAETWNG